MKKTFFIFQILSFDLTSNHAKIQDKKNFEKIFFANINRNANNLLFLYKSCC